MTDQVPFAPERRRRDLVVVAVTTAASLTATGLVLGLQERRRDERARAIDAPPGVDARGRPAEPVAETEADLDGDGQREVVTVLGWPHDPDLSWVGLRSTLSSGATRAAWVPGMPGPPLDARLAGTTDLDGDGREEAWVSVGETDGRRYLMFRLVGDELKRLDPGLPLRVSSNAVGTTTWGCYDDGRVYVGTLSRAPDGRASGVVRYYRLDDRWFVQYGGDEHQFRSGEPVPREYRPFVACRGVFAPRTRP